MAPRQEQEDAPLLKRIDGNHRDAEPKGGPSSSLNVGDVDALPSSASRTKSTLWKLFLAPPAALAAFLLGRIALRGAPNRAHGPDQACPVEYCAGDVVNVEPTVDSSSICPGLAAETLQTFEVDGDVWIELKGPSNMADAADLVISAPHGGDLRPHDHIEDRSKSGPYCPPPPHRCVTVEDSYTVEISELLQEKFIENYCKVPFLVINHLHRTKLDANRDIGEAAQGNAIAGQAWREFHNYIAMAQVELRAHFGTTTEISSTGSARTGVRSLLIDMHGYSGRTWVSGDGSPLIQWGYRLNGGLLENCPLDSLSEYEIGSMTHARWMEGHSYECLVRGPASLASRVGSLIDDSSGGLGTADARCGHGIPSFEFPSPQTLASDPTYCERMNGSNPRQCGYYRGGYITEVHARMDWEDEDNLGGDHINAVQAELPLCIRMGGSSVHENFAHKMSIATMSFLRDLYGDMP